MGGSSDDKSKKKVADPKSKVAPPSLLTFGSSGMDPTVMQQLRAGGLLGSSMPANYYQPVTVPLIQTPDQVEAYLISEGKTPTGGGSSPRRSDGGKGTPRRPMGVGEGGQWWRR